MTSPKVYFYIPGSESLNVLYFLAERYPASLVVITNSISVREVCILLELTCLYKVFYSKSEVKSKYSFLNFLNNTKHLKIIGNIAFKISNLIYMVGGIYRAKKMTKMMPEGSTLYYSTFFYDVLGIIFLRAAIKNNRIKVKLVWPNKVRFNKVEHPGILSEAYYLNVLTENLLVFHLHCAVGRVIGINPCYLHKRNVHFYHEEENITRRINYKLVNKAFSSIEIINSNKPKVIFLGDYSVEHGVSVYGKVYLDVLDVLANNKWVDVYYKPHPLYTSISHNLLERLNILDTQLPVEFFDDGSWVYIIAFSTNSFAAAKLSKCICLLKLDVLKMNANARFGFLDMMKGGDNKIIYPSSFMELSELLNGCSIV
jgi:hypothetical protein